LKQIGDGAPS